MFVELLRGALAPPLIERSLVRMWFPYLLCEEPILWLFSRIFFHMFSSPGSKGGLTLRSSITAYFCYLVHTNLDLKIHYELFRFGCAGEWEYVSFIFITWLQLMHFHYVTDNYLVCMIFTVLALKMLSHVWSFSCLEL